MSGSRTIGLLLSAVAMVALSACGGSSAADADRTVKDWLSAAATEDGATYCGLLTTDLLEKSTGEQGDAAVTACEKQVTEGTGNLPALVKVDPAKPQGENAADVPLQATVPSGTVSMLKEDDEFKINSVQSAPAKQPPKKPPRKKK